MTTDPWEVVVGEGPDWQLGDPRWLIYVRGWQAGYKAAERNAVERLSQEAVDSLILERVAEVLSTLGGSDGQPA